MDIDSVMLSKDKKLKTTRDPCVRETPENNDLRWLLKTIIIAKY